MDDNDHFIFAMDYPTRPKPDGTIAFQLLNERGADSGFIGEANLNDRLKLNGQGFKYTIIENVGNWYGQVKNSSGYYGKGRYVWGSEGLSNNLVNWEKNIFLSCDVSHDGNWIVCSMNPDNTKKTGWVLINTRERKVVKHWPNLKAKNAIWVWVGSVEQHPGFVR